MLVYTAPRATVQQVLLDHPLQVEAASCGQVQKVLHRLAACRTAALGYHLYRCSQEGCGHVHYQYHSCRDRHCPQCGALKKDEWIEARRGELLPVKYYHVVFTLPAALNPVVLGHRPQLLGLLFAASSYTLLKFGRDQRYLGAQQGTISVLHTWGQALSFHPHVHCVVSGGGITKEGGWKEATKSDYQFLFPVKALSEVYRGRFLQGLKTMIQKGAVTLPPGTEQKALFDSLYQKPWVVYAKAPFGGPEAVLEYLGRYTHKVAISNHRITAINTQQDTVTFTYKDYRDAARQKQMTLSATEFLRRFAQHVLPRGFTKVRTYGYLANRGRQQRITRVVLRLKLPPHPAAVQVPASVRLRERYGIDVGVCPVCGGKTLQLVAVQYAFKGGEDR
jgi:hypothetical protein